MFSLFLTKKMEMLSDMTEQVTSLYLPERRNLARWLSTHHAVIEHSRDHKSEAIVVESVSEISETAVVPVRVYGLRDYRGRELVMIFQKKKGLPEWKELMGLIALRT